MTNVFFFYVVTTFFNLLRDFFFLSLSVRHTQNPSYQSKMILLYNPTVGSLLSPWYTMWRTVLSWLPMNAFYKIWLCGWTRRLVNATQVFLPVTLISHFGWGHITWREQSSNDVSNYLRIRCFMHVFKINAQYRRESTKLFRGGPTLSKCTNMKNN